MDQLGSVLKCYKTPCTPYRLDSFVKDMFGKELLEMWRTNNRKGLVYTAWLYTEPAGFILLEKTKEYWTIRGTWVEEEFRGKQVGAFLMKNLLDDFWKEKPGCIWVNITPGAEGFYQKFGFNIVGYRNDTPEAMPVGIYANWTMREQIEAFQKHYEGRYMKVTGV